MVRNMWFWILVMVIGRVSTDTPPAPSSSLAEDYKDIIKLNKYSPALREFIAKILKAITIFDCYDLKIRESKPFFNEGSELSAAAFDALRWIKKSQVEYTKTVSGTLILLRDMEKAFTAIPDPVKGFDDREEPCFLGETKFEKEDCNACRDSTPSFKTKKLAKVELRVLIMQLQENVPKQFLFYASDIFIVTAEAIRMIDKTYSCLEENKGDCDTRDNVIAKFSIKMNAVATRLKDHVKMISQEKVKMAALVEQLTMQVQATFKLLCNCLSIKKAKKEESKATSRGNKGSKDTAAAMVAELKSIAKKYGLVFETIEAKDSGRFNIVMVKPPKKESVGNKVAKIFKFNTA